MKQCLTKYINLKINKIIYNKGESFYQNWYKVLKNKKD